MSKELFKSVSLVSLMTFISRILGFVRDLLAAQLFGVTASVDAFYIAFKIPNFMRNLFAEGAFSQAFVPVLSDYREKYSKQDVQTFVKHLTASFSLILLVITVLCFMSTNTLIHLFSPGLDSYRFHTASSMLAITIPYMMLISLTAFAGSILNSYGKFLIPSFTPALLNICLIITAIYFSKKFNIPIKSQAVGVLIAGFVQLFFQFPALYQIGFLLRPKFSWQDPGVKQVLKLLIPALFGASVGQISILLNTILASFLKIGSITWLYYSERLAYFPLGVFGVALATVVLPHLSKQHAKQSNEGFSSALDWGIRWNLIIGIPATLTMLILSGPLIISLFQYRKFTLFDVLMTQRSVIAYAVGLQAFMLIKILSSAFYSRQDIKTPVKISVFSLIFTMILSLIFIWPLKHAGLALATSIGSWANVTVLWTILHKRKLYLKQHGWGRFILQLIFANLMLSIFLWRFSGDTLTWINWHWTMRLKQITLLGLGGISIYIFCLWSTSASKQKLKKI